MVYNQITIAFGKSSRVTGKPINYQYDEKQILIITGLDLPEYYTVDFCNEGDEETIPMVGTAEGVQIPDDVMKSGKNVKAYIVLTGEDEDVQTRYEITIPVNVRPKRTDIQPTPEEQSEIDSLVYAMNDAVTRAEEAAASIKSTTYTDDGDGNIVIASEEEAG